MWLTTRVGFFSIVQKAGEKDLTIRSRVRGDLENLRQRYLPQLKIIESAGSDYPYRGVTSHIAFANAVQKMILDIDYSNFKNLVADEQGPQRSKIYGQVWSVLTSLERGKRQDAGMGRD